MNTKYTSQSVDRTDKNDTLETFQWIIETQFTFTIIEGDAPQQHS